jgi:glutaredoxin
MTKPIRMSLALCALLCAALPAQAQMYKWVDKDGRTVYSDQPPPADAKKVEQKRLNKNYIETTPGNYETQQAAQRLPVTLYSTEGCGEPCQMAKNYLNGRGVPFADTKLTSEEQAKPLKARLGGALEVPLLDIGGTTLQKGFEEGAWNNLLNAAGYPPAGSARARAATPPPNPPAR